MSDMKSTINFGYLIFLSVVAALGGFLFGYDKAITFEFSHFMSPQSAYLQAGHLYDRYKEYFEIK